MAAFEYKALDAKGKNKKGVIEADNARQVRQQLREQGMVPVEIVATAQKSTNGGTTQSKGRVRKVSSAELALLTRQVATLVQSALPIESALLAVAEQCDKAHHKSMMMGVRSKVVEGYSLAEGLGEYPGVFDKLYRAMVAAGEKSGHLDEVLNRLADYTEQRQQMKGQTVQALMYPGILTTFAIGVIGALLATVVPKIVNQFQNMGQELPGTTQFLIAASDFVRNYGLFVIAGIFLAIVVVKQLLKRESFRFEWDKRMLTLPLIGKVIKGQNTSRYARTLSILSSSAVPLLEGMQISGRILENTYMSSELEDAAGKVREGAALKTALEQTKLFPPMMLHMIASGEKSGELEQMLGRAADNQDREFEALVSISLKVFEPVLISVMAGMVLFIVVSILQPILALNNMVGI